MPKHQQKGQKSKRRRKARRAEAKAEASKDLSPPGKTTYYPSAVKDECETSPETGMSNTFAAGDMTVVTPGTLQDGVVADHTGLPKTSVLTDLPTIDEVPEHPEMDSIQGGVGGMQKSLQLQSKSTDPEQGSESSALISESKLTLTLWDECSTDAITSGLASFVQQEPVEALAGRTQSYTDTVGGAPPLREPARLALLNPTVSATSFTAGLIAGNLGDESEPTAPPFVNKPLLTPSPEPEPQALVAVVPTPSGGPKAGPLLSIQPVTFQYHTNHGYTTSGVGVSTSPPTYASNAPTPTDPTLTAHNPSTQPAKVYTLGVGSCSPSANQAPSAPLQQGTEAVQPAPFIPTSDGVALITSQPPQSELGPKRQDMFIACASWSNCSTVSNACTELVIWGTPVLLPPAVLGKVEAEKTSGEGTKVKKDPKPDDKGNKAKKDSKPEPEKPSNSDGKEEAPPDSIIDSFGVSLEKGVIPAPPSVLFAGPDLPVWLKIDPGVVLLYDTIEYLSSFSAMLHGGLAPTELVQIVGITVSWQTQLLRYHAHRLGVLESLYAQPELEAELVRGGYDTSIYRTTCVRNSFLDPCYFSEIQDVLNDLQQHVIWVFVDDHRDVTLSSDNKNGRCLLQDAVLRSAKNKHSLLFTFDLTVNHAESYARSNLSFRKKSQTQRGLKVTQPGSSGPSTTDLNYNYTRVLERCNASIATVGTDAQFIEPGMVVGFSQDPATDLQKPYRFMQFSRYQLAMHLYGASAFTAHGSFDISIPWRTSTFGIKGNKHKTTFVPGFAWNPRFCLPTGHGGFGIYMISSRQRPSLRADCDITIDDLRHVNVNNGQISLARLDRLVCCGWCSLRCIRGSCGCSPISEHVKVRVPSTTTLRHRMDTATQQHVSNWSHAALSASIDQLIQENPALVQLTSVFPDLLQLIVSAYTVEVGYQGRKALRSTGNFLQGECTAIAAERDTFANATRRTIGSAVVNRVHIFTIKRTFLVLLLVLLVQLIIFISVWAYNVALSGGRDWSWDYENPYDFDSNDGDINATLFLPENGSLV